MILGVFGCVVDDPLVYPGFRVLGWVWVVTRYRDYVIEGALSCFGLGFRLALVFLWF